MLLQAALNGNRGRSAHPALPVTVEALIADAREVVALGAGAIHLHPRDCRGRETLDPGIVDQVVWRVRSACGVPVGVSTGAWIEPDPRRRAALIAQWRAPDFASVNLSEDGAPAVIDACERAGIGIEAGLWTVQDAELLGGSGFAGKLVRVLVELIDLSPAQASTEAQRMHLVLDRGSVPAPRLQHGEGAATWPMLGAALDRGLDVRIGLEDTLQLPDGQAARSNADLVRVAVEMIDAGGA